MNMVTEPLLLFLHWLYQVTGNLGLSIIALTLIIRGVLLPITLPALKSQKKMKALQPKLNELKNKHKDDKTALSQAQMNLYKENNVNPLAGCLPYLVQFAVLIALYQVLRRVLGEGASEIINNVTFLGIDLTVRDSSYILPVMAAALQLLLSFMIMPGAETRNVIPDNSSSKSVKQLNEKEEDIQDMAVTMQRQMMFVMPIMTGVFAASFPAGLSLYWVITTAFSVVQQWFTTGPGGLAKYLPGMKTETVNWPQEIAKINKKSDKKIGKSIEKSNQGGPNDDFAAAFLNMAEGKSVKTAKATVTKKSTKSKTKKTSKTPARSVKRAVKKTKSKKSK